MDNTKSIGIMSCVNPRAATLVKNAIELQSGDAFVSFVFLEFSTEDEQFEMIKQARLLNSYFV